MVEEKSLVKNGCGIDIDSIMLVCSWFVTWKNGTLREYAVKSFRNNVAGILQLKKVLKKNKVTHVAFESTGVYWKLAYWLLEDTFNCILANPRYVKAQKGKKTDVEDSKWIAKMLRLGTIEKSFVPPFAIRELRLLTRQYRTLVNERTGFSNRIIKVLRESGITLDAEIKEMMKKKSVHLMLKALIAGKPTEQVADLAIGSMRPKIPAIIAALQFPLTPAAGQVLKVYFDLYLHLDKQIIKVAKAMEKQAKGQWHWVQRLCTMPGIATKSAICIIAEIGVDMKQFPTFKQLASWAGLCPGNNKSAGKSKGGRTRKANRYLRGALVQNAKSAVQDEDSEFHHWHASNKTRLGGNKSLVAIAHRLLETIYDCINEDRDYAAKAPKNRRSSVRTVRKQARNWSDEELDEYIAIYSKEQRRRRTLALQETSG